MKSILYVEDSIQDYEILYRLLSKEMISVLWVRNLYDAKKLCKYNVPFDLIVSDFMGVSLSEPRFDWADDYQLLVTSSIVIPQVDKFPYDFVEKGNLAERVVKLLK